MPGKSEWFGSTLKDLKKEEETEGEKPGKPP
jgi:hypothetical protein